MKLSFVIPAHNEEKRIGGCLDAILHDIERMPERKNDIEVVVVNNASTDDTRGAALRFLGVRVVDEPIPGIVKARARGFTASTGELVANIDADNMIPPGWLARVLREFDRDPKLVCLSGPLVYYDLSSWQQFLSQTFQWVSFAFHFLFRLLHIGALVQGGNFVLRRRAWERAGGFDTAIDFYGEDTDVARRMVRQGKVKYTFYLPILSSGRRIAREGILATGARYAVNYFWVLLTGRPFTKVSDHTRTHLTEGRGQHGE